MRHLAEYQETAFEKTSRLLSLFVLAPLLLALTLPGAVNMARHPDYGFTVHRLKVISVRVNGPAAAQGMQVGDRILAVGDRPTGRMHEYYAATSNNFGLRPRVFTVRGGGGQERQLTIQPYRPSQDMLIHNYSEWVVGLSFLLIGWWVLWGRPDPVARNFFGLCLTFTFFLCDIPDHANLTYMLAKDTLRSLLQLLMPAFFLRFFLQFPSRSRPAGGSPLRLRLLLLPGWLLFVVIAGLDAANLTSPGDRLESILEAVAAIYTISFFIAGLVVFARRVLRRDRPIQQTKLRVTLWGLLGGLLPFLAALIIANTMPGSSLPHWQYLSLSLVLVPVSFGLAIMRYGALDTGFVVRISLVYGVVTVLVILGYFLIVGLVGSTLARYFDVETWPLLVLIAAVSGLAILPLRNVVQLWVDNAFYPARRADRRAVNLLSEKLSALIEPDQVVHTIAADLQTLYRPESFALFLPTGSSEAGFRAAPARSDRDSAPAPAGSEIFLPEASGLSHLLNRLRRPVYREEIEDCLFAGEADSNSLRLLTRLNVALVVPLITGDRLLGFMAFGPKREGELFSQDDLANLRALAVQAASVFESRQLYQASLERKRLETELEVARDIQAHLLPDAPLRGDRFVISGRNVPCQKVGGDYFDYFTRRTGELCFAIADVSGKGIPAALMMTSVRVAFRQQSQAGVEPRELIAKLNEVVTALGSQGHFICFFYGIWSPVSGLLRYCNAGMEPPVLFSARHGYRQTLRLGGTVLGVDAAAYYREGSLELGSGDRLFLYTDGLTEERNAQDEFFDASRLEDLVDAHLGESPDALLGQVFAQVDAFGGAERSDDRTAIILEIN